MKKIVKKAILRMMELRVVCYYRLKVKRFLSHRVDKASLIIVDKKAIKEIWKPLSKLPSLKWHRFYATANKTSTPLYCPEDLFYAYIEPALNSMKMADAYMDKNSYDRFFPEINMPKTVSRCIRGRFYNERYEMLDEDKIEILPKEYIIKPTMDSSGGNNVAKLKVDKEGTFSMNGKLYTLKELKKYFRGDFIIQELIVQSSLLSMLNPSSVNTVRTITIRHNGSIVCLSGVLRFGNGDSIVDNISLGGFGVGIDFDLEIMKKYAYDRYGNKIKLHPATKFVFENQKVPSYKNIVASAKKIHEKLHYFDLVSCDFTIDKENNPIFLEINLKEQGVNLHQLSNGALFGNYTQNVIQDTLKARKQYD